MENYSVLDKLLSLFGRHETTEEPEIETDLAAASLMLEVSWSDHDVGAAELLTMRRLYQNCTISVRTKSMLSSRMRKIA